jgi:hypothetical protein
MKNPKGEKMQRLETPNPRDATKGKRKPLITHRTGRRRLRDFQGSGKFIN